MSISHYKRFEDAPYDRVANGFLVGINSLGLSAPSLSAPPLKFAFYSGDPLPRICVSGIVSRSYLTKAGFRVAGAGGFVTSYIDNGALLSAGNTGKNNEFTYAARQAFNTYEGVQVPLKLEIDANRLRTIVENNVYVQDVAPIAGFLATDVALIYGITDGGAVAAGNDYTCTFDQIIVCKSNDITFRSLPQYGSVRVTVNNNAPIVVNMDGNGDGLFYFGNQRFPCAMKYEVFKGANATGAKVGQVRVPLSTGGDIFANSRAELAITPFSPKASVKRCELWLAPEALQGADGSLVNTWPDSSGAGRDFVKLPSSGAPTLRRSILAQPSVDFTSGQVLYNNALEMRTNNQTVAIVLRHRTEGTPHGYISQTYNGAAGWNLNNNGGAGLLSLFPGYIPISGAAQDVITYVVLEFDKVNNSMRAFLNGSDTPSYSVAYSVVDYQTITTALGAFYCDQPTAYSALLGSALIGEVVIYSTKLRTAERQALAAYMKAKWGNAW